MQETYDFKYILYLTLEAPNPFSTNIYRYTFCVVPQHPPKNNNNNKKNKQIKWREHIENVLGSKMTLTLSFKITVAEKEVVIQMNWQTQRQIQSLHNSTTPLF